MRIKQLSNCQAQFSIMTHKCLDMPGCRRYFCAIVLHPSAVIDADTGVSRDRNNH